ncbi:MAG TPA: DUF3050 domain-containing protein [Pirellulales bacterium]
MSIEQLRAAIEPFRQTLLNHPIYQDLGELPALRTFMERHVFAVWDFMSLLKALQKRLSCVDTPWLPGASTLGCRLVNEIVLGEESDQDGAGGFASHFELYHRAMRGCGASTAAIDQLLAILRKGAPISQALQQVELDPAVRDFVLHTFATIESNDLCAIASAFTFGREDLLPDVFQQIVRRLNHAGDGRLDSFEYYLRRHIQLDADEHGPMAARLMQSLCGDAGKWRAAEEAAVAALEARIAFWDAIHVAIRRNR